MVHATTKSRKLGVEGVRHPTFIGLTNRPVGINLGGIG